MYQRKIPEMLDCGLVVALKVIGGKWKAWIIDCIRRDIRRPSALHREMNTIAPRVINLHLKELEEYGILYKVIFADVPPRVEYRLTAVGESLLPLLSQLEDWGNANKEIVNRHVEEYSPGSCQFLPEQKALKAS